MVLGTCPTASILQLKFLPVYTAFQQTNVGRRCFQCEWSNSCYLTHLPFYSTENTSVLKESQPCPSCETEKNPVIAHQISFLY